MHPKTDVTASRRRFVKFSGLAALTPLIGIAGCSESPPPAKPAERTVPSTAPPAAAKPAPEPKPAAPAPDLIKLEESDATAQALGYRHSVSDVDQAKFPKYQAGQNCGNCSLYQADAGDDPQWGGCTLFPGKLVAADGWCNGYIPKA